MCPDLMGVPALTRMTRNLRYESTIDWVVCGGESGPGARPMDLEWARDLRDQCRDAGVPFWMKQMGGHPNKRARFEDIPEDLRIREFPNEAQTD